MQFDEHFLSHNILAKLHFSLIGLYPLCHIAVLFGLLLIACFYNFTEANHKNNIS